MALGRERKRRKAKRDCAHEFSILRVYSVGGGKFRVESIKLFYYQNFFSPLRVTISTRLLVQGYLLFSRVEINFFLYLEESIEGIALTMRGNTAVFPLFYDNAAILARKL